MQKLNSIFILSALIILFVSLKGYVQQHSNKQEDTILHQERVGVVEEEENSRKDIVPQEINENTKETRQTAKVSWYDRSCCGEREYGKDCKTASGEIFDEQALTVAHKTVPFGTLIQFRYGDRSVVCRVNDRGPFVSGREWDMSRGCFESLTLLEKGVIEVEWRVSPQ